jgi:hypothetical protein
MATRPIFIPLNGDFPGVDLKLVEFQWFPGMAVSQSQKSIASLHEAGNKLGIFSILEISSKSKNDLGVNLSAFNLCFTTKKYKRTLSIESAYQGSKVFEQGGPYIDLFEKHSREAKKDIRLKQSGNLTCFKFFGETFSLQPTTHFYDWIYINALNQISDLGDKLLNYKGFTDIAFNPDKSLNCQAYAAALYVSLRHHRLLEKALSSRENFLDVLKVEYQNKSNSRYFQRVLF